MLNGIDISSWQGDVNFDSVKKENYFVLMKATEGVGFRDPKLSRNQSECRRLNIPRGYYHFARADLGNSPESEADYFLDQLGELQEKEILVLDFEANIAPFNFAGDVVDWSYKFLKRIKDKLRYKAILYTNPYTINSKDWKSVIDGDHGLWIACPDNNIEIPAVNWPVVAIKQYSWEGSFAGTHPVDLNLFYGDLETFQKYGVQSSYIVKYNKKEVFHTQKYDDALKEYKINLEKAKESGGRVYLIKVNPSANQHDILLNENYYFYGVDHLGERMYGGTDESKADEVYKSLQDDVSEYGGTLILYLDGKISRQLNVPTKFKIYKESKLIANLESLEDANTAFEATKSELLPGQTIQIYQRGNLINSYTMEETTKPDVITSNTLGMFLKDFAQRLSSRKFLAALFTSLIVVGNSVYDWGLSQNELELIAAAAIAFIAGESAIDATRANSK